MTNAELIATIQAKIEKLVERYCSVKAKGVFQEGYKGGRLIGYEDALNVLKRIQEESEKPMNPSGSSEIPKDLEEAADLWYEKCPFPKLTCWNEGEELKLTDSRETFIAGAKWQKEQDTREMIMSDGSYFQKCYELGKKDILSKFTKEHLEGLKWIERAGISTQPVPYHKYCKDLYKVLEELLKEKYDIQGDTSI